jgi:hypothetical protein
MEAGSIVIAVIVVCATGAAMFFALANRATRRVHAAFGPKQVESALRCALDDSGYHDEFDLFLAWPIDDPYLESIRRRCHEIIRISGPARAGDDVSQEGKDRIREILRELRERA